MIPVQDNDWRCSQTRNYKMTLKTSALSMFALVLVLSASTAITRAYADSDHDGAGHGVQMSDHDGDQGNGAEANDDASSGAEANDDSGDGSDNDDAGPVTMGNKKNGKGCFVKRADGVKVPC
jgi:hypothetical protein